MSRRTKDRIRELRKMLEEKEPDEATEQVLTKFCARKSVSLRTCRKYYKILVESGEISEKQ